jgi:hypothetical protein
MSLPCLFNCGGDSPQTVTQTQTGAPVTVNNSTTVQTGATTVSIGGDFLKPLGQAFSNTFVPIAESVEQGIKTSSNQAASIAQQAQQIADFSKKSQSLVVQQQADLGLIVKILAALSAAGLLLQLVRLKGGS